LGNTDNFKAPEIQRDGSNVIKMKNNNTFKFQNDKGLQKPQDKTLHEIRRIWKLKKREKEKIRKTP